jgi:hypothetical protein
MNLEQSICDLKEAICQTEQSALATRYIWVQSKAQRQRVRIELRTAMAAAATSEEADALKLKADEECEELDRKIELLSSEIVMAEAEIDAMTKQLEAWKGRGLEAEKTQQDGSSQIDKGSSPEFKGSYVDDAGNESFDPILGDQDKAFLDDQERKAKVPSNLPTYGKKGEADPRKFIELFEAKMIANAFPENRWASVLPGQMESTALIRKLKKLVKRSWDVTKREFLNSQLSTQIEWIRKKELQTVVKDKNESVREYAERFQDLVDLVGTEGTDEDWIIMQFTQGFRNERTFLDKLENALICQQSAGYRYDLDKVVILALDLAAREQIREGKVERVSTTKKFKGNCRWCQKPGHKEAECRSRKQGLPKAKEEKNEVQDDKRTTQKQCYRCGKNGHIARNCTENERKKVQVTGQARQVNESKGENEEKEREQIRYIVNVPSEDEADDAWMAEVNDIMSDESEEVRRVAVEEQKKGKKQWLTPCYIDGNPVMAVVDSGATISILSDKKRREWNLDLLPQEGLLQGAFNGQHAQSSGKVKVELRNGETILTTTLRVAELASDDLLIGTDLFDELGYEIHNVPTRWPDQKPEEEEEIINMNEEELRLQATQDTLTEEEKRRVQEEWGPYIEGNQKLPDDTCCTYPGAELKIETKNSAPVFVRQYPIARHLRDKVTERVQEWQQKGWIEKSAPGNPWSFPLVAVPKKDGKGGMSAMRLCIDLRMLNGLIEDEPYPIPKIYELLSNHYGHRYFATLDQADSYHQWLLRKEDKHKVAFIWNGVHYNFVRACFGVKTMTALFQRIMTEMLSGIDGVGVYVDDVIIATKTFEEFLEAGKHVLEKMNKYGVKLRTSKCVFGATELKHLGRVISRQGFRPDPHKIAEICNWQKPSTGKSLKSFVCLAGYFREHIRDFATLVEPLQAATMQRNLRWNENMEKAFQLIKSKFADDDLTLAYPDLTKEMHLYVDASDIGMGAALMQEQGGRMRMIIAISRAFRGSEKHYSATKKELRAVVWALTRLEQLLLAGRFTLHTDHAALTFLLTQKHMAPMLARWVDSILRFNFRVVHVPGHENVIADALSRQYEK